MVESAHFEAGHAVNGKAIVASFLSFHIEDWEGVRGEAFGPKRLDPDHHLPLGDGERAERGDGLCGPWSRGNNKAAGAIRVAIGLHLDARATLAPLDDALAAVNFRAERLGGHHMSRNRTLRQNEAAV